MLIDLIFLFDRNFEISIECCCTRESGHHRGREGGAARPGRMEDIQLSMVVLSKYILKYNC